MRIIKIALMCGFVLGVVFPAVAFARKNTTMYVEAETLVAGKWKVHQTGSASEGKFLYGSKNSGPLKTSIKLPRKGKYHVWVRLRAERTTRRGRITINGRASGVLSKKGRERWKWYNLGVYECSVLKLVLEGLDPAPGDVWYDTFFITETSEAPSPAAIKRPEPVWIWSKKKTHPGSDVFFRRYFSLPDKAEGGRLLIRASGPYVVYVNGLKAARGDNWRENREFDVKRHLRKGENLLAIRCRQGKGVEGGGLRLEVKIKLSSGGKISLRSGNEFRVQEKELSGWNRVDFDSSSWWHAREYWANPLRKFTVSEKRLFEELNLNYPGLEKVKAAWAKGDSATAKKELLKYYRTRRKPKYFFDWRKKNEIVSLIDSKFPNYYRKQIARADSYMTHIFTFEGDKRFVGKDVNWFQDSPGGNKSYAILLSSLNWLTPLLSSYWATGDEKYVREYVYMTDDWIKDNLRPLLTMSKKHRRRHDMYKADIVAWLLLVPGVRLRAWVDAHNYLLSWPPLDAEFHTLLLRSMLEHAEDLIVELQLPPELENKPFKAGNWRAVACVGLFSASVMFPEFKKSEMWRKKTINQLNQMLQGSVYDDGGYWELNSGYQAWVMRKMFDAMLLAKRNNIKLPPEFYKKYEKTYDYLVAISMPDLTWPMRADCKLGSGGATGGRDMLLRASILYGRGDFKFIASRQPSVYDMMMFGGGVFDDYRKIKARPPSYTSIALPNSQHVIMRTGWSREDKYMFFDCAPDCGGHAHRDHLNINVHGYGQLLITESGMPCYDWKIAHTFFTRSVAHNVVMIDGRDHRRKMNPDPVVENFVTTANFDFAQGLLQNYVGAKQQRSIFFLKPDYWIMVDRLDEMKPSAKPKTRNVKQLFHFAPTILTTDEKAKTVYTNYARGNVLLAPAGAAGVKLVEKQGWVAFSRTYMPKAPYVEYQRQGTFPMVMPLVIYPYPGKQCPPPITTKLLAVSSNGRPIAVTQALCVKVEHEKRGTDYFILSWAKGKTLACDGISSDGQAACIRYNPEGEITSAFIVGGKRITDKNGIVVESDKMLKKCDVKYRSNTIVVETDTGARVKVRTSGRSKVIINRKETPIPAGKKIIEIKSR